MIGGLVVIAILALALLFLVIKIYRKWSSKSEDEERFESVENGRNPTTFLKNDELLENLRWKITVTFVKKNILLSFSTGNI